MSNIPHFSIFKRCFCRSAVEFNLKLPITLNSYERAKKYIRYIVLDIG